MATSFHYVAQHDQILVEENSFARTLILNRPQKLNALSYTMISQLLKNFKANEEDSNVKLVIVKGMGKTFSASGDAKAAALVINEGHWTFAATIYAKQLSLNYVMATYRKPQVSLINGAVMGGGAGVSMHWKFRVVTENTVFAMPETSLGLFPDVGASYFLSRLPGFLGEYLGLTGTRLDGAKMLACGLATHFILSLNLPLLEEALKSINSADPAIVCTKIDQFSMKGVLKESSVLRRLDTLNKCFSKATVEEIVLILEHETVNETEEWIAATIKSLKKASPINLKVFLRSWEPSKLESISEEMVDQYFKKVDEKDWEDLKLPTRGKLTNQARAKL